MRFLRYFIFLQYFSVLTLALLCLLITFLFSQLLPLPSATLLPLLQSLHTFLLLLLSQLPSQHLSLFCLLSLRFLQHHLVFQIPWCFSVLLSSYSYDGAICTLSTTRNNAQHRPVPVLFVITTTLSCLCVVVGTRMFLTQLLLLKLSRSHSQLIAHTNYHLRYKFSK